MEKGRRFCFTSINAGFGAASAAVVILILLNAANQYVNAVDFKMLTVCLFVLFTAALTAAVYLLCTRCTAVRNMLRRHPFRVLAVLMLAVCTCHILVVRAVYTPIGWDVGMIINAAGDLSPEQSAASDIYFTRYPNNVLMTALFKLFFWLVRPVISDVWLSSALLSVLAVDAGIVLICLTAKRIFGLKTYYLTLWLSLLLIAVHPTIFIPYSDSIALPFTAGFLFSAAMLLTAKTRRVTYLYALAAGFLLIAGYYIKPTVLIAGIAALILLILSIQKPNTKRVLTFCLCALLFLGGGGCAVLLNQAARPLVYTQVPDEQQQDALEVPMSHYLMMGLNEREGYYGGFFQEDVNETFAIPGRQAKTDYHKTVIAQRLQEFGAVGFVKHCVHKMVWVTTDGTFMYGGEGIFHAGVPKKTTGIGGWLQNFTYISTDIYQHAFGNYLQAIWLITAAGMALHLFDRGKNRPQAQRCMLFIMELSVGGLILFLMLFEARSRYLFLYLPTLILLAATGYQTLFQRLRTRREKHD